MLLVQQQPLLVLSAAVPAGELLRRRVPGGGWPAQH